MRIVFITVALSFCLTASLALIAQDSTAILHSGIRYGVNGTFGINVHQARFLILPGGIRETIDNGAANLDYSFNSGLGLHGSGSAFVEFPLLSWLNLGVHIGIFNKSARLESLVISTPAGRFDGTETELRAQRIMDVDIQTVAPEFLFGIMPVQGLNLYAGLRGDIIFRKTYYQREEMTAETDGTFENGLRVRKEVRGDVPDVRNLGIANFNPALTGGLGFEFSLGNNRAFSLEVRAMGDVGIFNLLQRMDRPDDEWWRINSVRAGFALRYYPEREKTLGEIEYRLQRLQELEKVVVAERTKIQSELKELKQSGLAASITRVTGRMFSGKEVENPRIRLEKTAVSTVTEWQPIVYFNERSSVLPARYKRLQTAETQRFSIEELSKKPLIPVASQVLNIIGKRLSEETAATITLVGFRAENTSESTEKTLATDRTQAVREYLSTVWKIAPERMTTKEEILALPSQSSESAQILARRVEIRSNEARLLRPLSSESTMLLSDMSALTFSLDIRSGQGLKEWVMEISQFDEREIKTLALFRGKKDVPPAITWKPSPENGSMPISGNVVNVKLDATDVANRSIDAVPMEIPVEMPQNPLSTPTAQLRQYILFLNENLEIPSATVFNEAQKTALVRISGQGSILTPKLLTTIASKLRLPQESLMFNPEESSKDFTTDEITPERLNNARSIRIEILEQQ